MEIVNHLQTQLSKDMEKLWNSKSGTDVTFRVEGKFLEAHKFLLTSKNPTLTTYLSITNSNTQNFQFAVQFSNQCSIPACWKPPKT